MKWAIKLLNKYKPKLVLFTDGGSMHYASEAANKFGISSAEIQHGSVTPYSLIRNYKNIDATLLTTKPDIIFTFGKFWHDRYGNNISKYVLGCPFHDKVLFQAEKKNKISKKSILAVSTLDHQLVKLMIGFAKKCSDFEIFYKLRSEEYRSWESLYPYDINSVKNFHMVDNDEINIINRILNADYIISSDSTAIYEALHLKKRCIIFKGVLWEMQESLIDENVVPLVKNVEELEQIVNSKWDYNLVKSEIYAKYDSEMLYEHINEIISK